MPQLQPLLDGIGTTEVRILGEGVLVVILVTAVLRYVKNDEEQRNLEDTSEYRWLIGTLLAGFAASLGVTAMSFNFFSAQHQFRGPAELQPTLPVEAFGLAVFMAMTHLMGLVAACLVAKKDTVEILAVLSGSLCFFASSANTVIWSMAASGRFEDHLEGLAFAQRFSQSTALVSASLFVLLASVQAAVRGRWIRWARLGTRFRLAPQS